MGYDEVHAMNPNSQVEVSLLLDSVSTILPIFDHFSQAHNMGLMNSGVEVRQVDNFSCATRDLA